MGTHNYLAKEQAALRAELELTAASQTLSATQLKGFGTIVANKGSAITITIPAASEAYEGMVRNILNRGAGALTVAVAAGFGGSGTTSVTASQGDTVSVVCDGLYWYTDSPAASAADLASAQEFTGVKTFSAAPLVTINDATDSAVTDVITLTHSTSAGTFGATGIGTGISIRSEDGSGNIQQVASIDSVLTTVTDGSEDGDVIISTILNAAVQPALTIDASEQSVTLGQNVTDPDGIFKTTIYPVTTAKGSLVVQAVANDAANVQTIIQNGQSGATSTFTTPTAASGVFALTANATGAISRSDITEEAFASHLIPVYSVRAADGNVLGIADTGASGDHYLAYTAGTWALMGNSPTSNTQTDVSLFQFQLPPNYVAAGDVKLRISALYTTIGDTQTLDLEAFEIVKATGAAGADICATAIATLTDTATAHDFTITATDLVAGDLLSFIMTTVFQDADGSVGEAKINNVELLCDVKG